MTGPARFAGHSRIFTVHSKGGGSGSSPAGPPSSTPRFAGRSNIFTVPKGGGSGGGLFKHGCIQTNRSGDETLWDSDGYIDDMANVSIPSGLGGIYLVLSTFRYGSSGTATSGWQRLALTIQSGGSGSWSDGLAQWQQGYRAFNTLGGIYPYPTAAIQWVGELVDSTKVNAFLVSSLNPPGVQWGGLVNFSLFRLGDVGDVDPEPAFHGALTYRISSSLDYSDEMFGATLFDTDSYYYEQAAPYPTGALIVPPDLGGLYLVMWSWTYTIYGNGWQPEDVAGDCQLIPWMWCTWEWSSLSPNYFWENADNEWPCQVGIGGFDHIDCDAYSNEVTLSSYWIGNLPDGGAVQSLLIPDCDSVDQGYEESGVIIATDSAKSYMAMIRLGDAVTAGYHNPQVGP